MHQGNYHSYAVIQASFLKGEAVKSQAALTIMEVLGEWDLIVWY